MIGGELGHPLLPPEVFSGRPGVGDSLCPSLSPHPPLPVLDLHVLGKGISPPAGECRARAFRTPCTLCLPPRRSPNAHTVV